MNNSTPIITDETAETGNQARENLIGKHLPPPKPNKDRQAFLKAAAEHMKCKALGFAGFVGGTGTLVDRRDYPDAIPVPANRLLGVPEPTRCGNQKCRSLRITRTACPDNFRCLECGTIGINPKPATR